MDQEELKRRIDIVANSYAGILPGKEVFFLVSIQYSAERSLAAFKRYDNIEIIEDNATKLVSLIQEGIGHAAALSRYFFPSEHSPSNVKEMKLVRMARAKKLREAFSINESSPIFNRKIRNAWEHFDELLDYYLLENEAGYFFPTPMLGEHNLADEPEGKIFKLLDVENKCLVILGKKYFYEPIRSEVERIYKLAIKMDQNGGRLNRL